MNRLILLYAFLFYSCYFYGQEVRSLTKKEEKRTIIGMGIRNLPDFFYDHYYRYPESVQEFCLFLQNHYDYVEAKEEWEPLVKYLRKKEKRISFISDNGLFIIHQGKHLLYLKRDICSTLASHYPEKEYVDYVTTVNFYDLRGRNLKELIGVERADSIAALFTQLKQGFYDLESVNGCPQENTFVQYDKFRRVLLKYEISSGLQKYCSQEPLILSDYSFFSRLENLCYEFCKQQNLNKIIFTDLVFE